MRSSVLSAVGAGAVKYRVVAGRLHPIPGHRGVFLVGHAARTPLTMYWAAHLAVGPSSVISHRSAAALRELRTSRSAFVELTVPGPSRRRGRGLRVHRTTWLPDADVVEIDGLPVTSVARTLLDRARWCRTESVERAFDRAVVANRLDLGDVQRVLHEGAARPGAATLRAVAPRDVAGTTLTETDLEELLLAIVRRAGLPEPICQHPVLEYRADLCWPAARLIAEADGPAHDRLPVASTTPAATSGSRTPGGGCCASRSARSSATRSTSRVRSGRGAARLGGQRQELDRLARGDHVPVPGEDREAVGVRERLRHVRALLARQLHAAVGELRGRVRRALARVRRVGSQHDLRRRRRREALALHPA